MKRCVLVSTSTTFDFIVLSVAACWTSLAIAQQQGVGPSKSAQAGTHAENPNSAAPKGPADGKAEEFASAIQDLASRSFQARQAAYEKLVAAGDSAIDALEHAAKVNQIEVATRCAEALAQIARDGNNAKAGLAALERLAADPTNRVSRGAAHLVTDLKMTNEDRAVAALKAEGVRMHRRANGEVNLLYLERDGQLPYLKHISSVRSITLSGRNITDAGIAYLAQAKQLTDLSLLSTSVTDTGLRKLDQLPKLERLSLSGQFSSEGLQQLQRIKSLRSLALLSSMDKRSLGFLVGLSQINNLSLSELQLSKELVDIINQCKHLSSCFVSLTKANDIQLQLVGQLQVPLHLSLMSSPNVTESGWKHLEGGKLVGLNMMRTPITDAGLIHIGAIPTLQSLSISYAPISDAGLINLSQLKMLNMLTLQGTNVTDDGIANLRRSLPNLRHASLRAGAGVPAVRRQDSITFNENKETGKKNAHLRSRLTADHVKELKLVPNLDSLFLSDGSKDEDLSLLGDVPLKGLVINSVHVTDRGIKSLEEHSTLESLAFWSSSITDGSLESLARMRQLTSLTIQKAPITDEGIAALIGRLSEVGKLKTLNLFKCPNVTDEGLKKIERLTSLERLFLNNNDGLTSSLLAKISHLTNLNRLEIDSIALDEADLIHLAKLTKLETLGLSCSNSKSKLTDRGLAFVSQVPSLQSLTIQSAKFTDVGVPDLLKLKKLRFLDLSHTEITDQGLESLAKEFPNLLRLGLTGTHVTDAAMVHVGKLTQLEHLTLSETKVGDEGLKRLDRLTKLQYVYVNSSTVTNDGQLQFKLAHPTTELFMFPR